MVEREPLPARNLLILLVGIPAAVLGLVPYPLVTLIALAGLATYVLYRRTDPSWRRLFLWAALFGTLGEAVCVYGHWTTDGRGLWIYAFPSPFGWNLKLPVWLPLVWGNLFMLFAGIAERVAPTGPPRRGAEIGRYLMMLALVAYAGALFRIIDIRILWLFTPFFAAFVLYWNQSRDLAVFTCAAVLGSFGEILAMHQQLWFYTMPVISADWTSQLGVKGIPLSLAMAWGLSAVFLTRLSGRAGTPPDAAFHR